MTWHWQVEGDELRVWDHTQDPTTDAPIETVTAPEGGWSWTGDLPDAVWDLVAETIDANRSSKSSDWMSKAITAAACDRIEEFQG